MKSPIWLPVLAIAALLSLGSFDCPQAPAQNTRADNGSLPSNQPLTDTWITAKVKAELASTHGVDSTHVSVATNNGIVVLTGVLSSDIAVRKAVAVTQSVKGVANVDSSGLKSRG